MIVALSTLWLHACHPRWACRGMVISPTHASPGQDDHIANLHLSPSALLCCKVSVLRHICRSTLVCEEPRCSRRLGLAQSSGPELAPGPPWSLYLSGPLRQSMTASTQKERKEREKTKRRPDRQSELLAPDFCHESISAKTLSALSFHRRSRFLENQLTRRDLAGSSVGAVSVRRARSSPRYSRLLLLPPAHTHTLPSSPLHARTELGGACVFSF